MTDHLDDFGAVRSASWSAASRQESRLPILDGALDELVRLEGLFGLLGDRVGYVGFTDEDDGVEVMGEGAKLTDLLAGECHVSTRFLRERFLQVNDTAPSLVRQAVCI